MALSVLDGNQSATTLSSVVTGGEHIVAHTVVSLGSTAISNITSAVSGVSVSISGTAAVTIPSLNHLANSVATNGVVDATINFVKIGGHQSGGNQTANIVHVSSGGSMSVDATDSVVSISNFPATQTVAGTVTVGNSVTIGSLPAISGTVTVGNTVTVAGTVTANVSGDTVYQDPNGLIVIKSAIYAEDINAELQPVGFYNPLIITGTVTANPTGTQTVAGTVTANVSGDTVYYDDPNGLIAIKSAIYAENIDDELQPVGFNNPLIIAGTVTVGNTVTVAGTVTANLNSDNAFVPAIASDSGGGQPFYGVQLGYFNGEDDSFNLVQQGGGLPIAGTVTVGNLPSGALTTRFGSVVTAGTAQLTSAVTNASRKYLLLQNISTGAVTVGVGFVPTTTQGIALAAGAGLTFDAFCPTGAVHWLGGTAGAPFTILEG